MKCQITGQEDCRERSCELHYMNAPVRIAPSESVFYPDGELAASFSEKKLAPHAGCNWQGCRECFPKGKEFVYLVVCSGRVVAAFAGYEEARRQAESWNGQYPTGDRFRVQEWLVRTKPIPVTE